MGNRQTNHHAAHHKQEPTPASAASNTSLRIHDRTGYSDSTQIKLAKVSRAEAAPTGMVRMSKAEMRMEQQVKDDSKTSGLENDDAFSDYINRTKVKIRAMSSNVGIERGASSAGDVYETKQEDNGKDVFTDFLNRAKFKIRKTSSIGSRRNM